MWWSGIIPSQNSHLVRADWEIVISPANHRDFDIDDTRLLCVVSVWYQLVLRPRFELLTLAKQNSAKLRCCERFLVLVTRYLPHRYLLLYGKKSWG